MQQTQAIVLAMFGTTVEAALGALLAIRDAVRQAFPQTPVRLAFTSNQIRRIWNRRAADPAYLAAHPDIPAEILQVQGPLAAIANLQDRGYDTLIVQPTHIVPAEEFHDLRSYVNGLNSIRTLKPRWQPFKTIALGRPLLGAYSLKHTYADDILIVARALAEDAALARRHDAALVYMGHGNHYFPSGGLYLEFAARMRQLYPDVRTLIGTVEGFPSLEEIREDLHLHGLRRVLLKPFLVVAGDHARNDLAGPEEDSWQSILIRDGVEVIPVLTGLGEQPAIAGIFVNHIAEAAADAGLKLS
ncbi:sirohydrochlorin cobaltochelatase [Desulfobulbus alkaliphilus]|uniref:sirohydrochlorin cobaltochelatase n=1 Tax=Desulfobulbus alkaliphilus TaxID=869814 RepID=UPI00196598EA|nr:sirohydrochlorin cobaltochelatase [Desulfobulbus alkaliphilus]MBM9537045.1 sirohydrochlorin cobaltochelatase [Desulfobulbus alkaliphilus]